MSCGKRPFSTLRFISIGQEDPYSRYLSIVNIQLQNITNSAQPM
ncbi:hypothetical protein THF1D04_500002 [Vibrio owensii]|uniref:Uncharacterized protein n=1 Tax=Vibrio owensii TaxID=696485 RepID=A0AAU9QD86_9VIBR|nr:hypothetical protein THF1D04_500002 [Vibrio owensii]